MFDQPEPPRPVNWNLLTAHELEQEWLALNDWVAWLRRTYGPVSYTHLRAHETVLDLVCRLLLEKKKKYHTHV